jgi:hypothetical protein
VREETGLSEVSETSEIKIAIANIFVSLRFNDYIIKIDVSWKFFL